MQTQRASRPRLAPTCAVKNASPSFTPGVRQVLDKFVRLPGIYHLLKHFGISKFKKFATEGGIDWDVRIKAFEAVQQRLDAIYEETNDAGVIYPWYYLQPFHAYETGHLNWRAAFEVENALEALCMRQFGALKGRPEEAKQKLQNNIGQAWKERLPVASRALDMACGVGISTSMLTASYPEAIVTGIDLSPHALSVAKYKQEQGDGAGGIEYIHMNAEDATKKFPSGSFDIVALTFTIHECPRVINEKLAKEAYELCRPGGMFSITESDNRSSLFVDETVWKKSIQQMTEPFIAEYAMTDVRQILADAGFEKIEDKSVSPKYCTWTAFKPCT